MTMDHMLPAAVRERGRGETLGSKSSMGVRSGKGRATLIQESACKCRSGQALRRLPHILATVRQASRPSVVLGLPTVPCTADFHLRDPLLLRNGFRLSS